MNESDMTMIDLLQDVAEAEEALAERVTEVAGEDGADIAASSREMASACRKSAREKSCPLAQAPAPAASAAAL